MTAIESPTPALVDVAMRGLPAILPILDFSTIKNELFPVIATVFSKTNSLAIKVRGLQAFVVLCGGSNNSSGGSSDGLDGFGVEKKKTSSSSALDKYTMQEKIVPLIKAIKTKEPAVMVAALNVLRVIGDVADADFVAMDILPILWSMSLGPLLDLKQFQTFMELIKSLSRRVEDEQTKKLQELSGGNTNGKALENEDFMAFGGITGTQFDSTNGASADDFERLVKGKATGTLESSNPMDSGGWDSAPARAASPRAKSPAPAFSWSTPSPATAGAPFGGFGAPPKPQSSFRTVTPDLGNFQTLSPSSTQYSQPLQPISALTSPTTAAPANPWGATTPSAPAANPWASSAPVNTMSPLTTSMSGLSMNQQRPPMQSSMSSFSLAPPPTTSSPSSAFSLPRPPGVPQMNASTSSLGQTSNFGGMSNTMNAMGNVGSMNSMMGTGMAALKPMNTGGSMGSMGMNSMNNGMNKLGGMNNIGVGGIGGVQSPPQPQQNQQRSGLDKYESLI